MARVISYVESYSGARSAMLRRVLIHYQTGWLHLLSPGRLSLEQSELQISLMGM
jgi:hypothetical protein